MEKLSTKALGLMLITAMLLSVIPAYSAAPPAADALWIEPYPGGINLSTASESIGHVFMVTAWAKSSIICGAWSIRLAYEFAYLTFLNASYTAGAKSAFFTPIATVPVAPSHAALGDGIRNRIDFGESWGGFGPKRDPGSDSLANYWFNVTAVPVKGGNINSFFYIQEFDLAHLPASPKTYMIDDASAKYGSGYDTPYNFVWAPPAAAYLISAPSMTWPVSNIDRTGEVFTETISVNVGAAWYMTQCNFTMSFNPTWLEINSVVLNVAVWDAYATAVFDNVLGTLRIEAGPSGSIGGTVLIATVEFEIIFHDLAPTVHTSNLAFSAKAFEDHVQSIPQGTDTVAVLTLPGIQVYAYPILAVVPTVTYFELPPAGTVFTVDIEIHDLHSGWQLVGLEFRLQYNDEWLEVIDVDEGPYLPGYAPFGTWYTSFLEVGPAHVLVGELILPNGSGYWNPPFPGDDPETGPNGDGVVTTITFRTKKALSGPGVITLPLNLFNSKYVTALGKVLAFTEEDGVVIFNDAITTGRVVDVYGAACNAGYGPAPEEPWPAPYGGQGLNNPMDLVIPQSCVCLWFDVTYNGWPVQQKDVNIEVEGPYYHIDGEYIPKQSWMILLKLSARTNETGQAKICFTMPWPCDNPEDMLGVWKVTATVNIVDVVVTDTLYYYYDYMVHIWKVTTDKYFYAHCEDILVTVEYGSHAMLTYPGLVSVVIMDELMVPFMGLTEITVGGARFCEYANGSVTIPIHVMKWWFVGFADIYVNIFDKDPTVGGFNWYKQVFLDDFIYILPEWA